VFWPIKAGIAPYTATDHDLFELIRHPFEVVPVTVTYEWVKGHYSGPNKELKPHLDQDADAIAGQFQLNPEILTRLPGSLGNSPIIV